MVDKYVQVERNNVESTDAGTNTLLIVLVVIILLIGGFWLLRGGAADVDDGRTIDVNVDTGLGGGTDTGGTGGTGGTDATQ